MTGQRIFSFHELGHRCVTFGADVPRLENANYGKPDNLQVQSRTDPVRIPYVQIEFLFPHQCIPPIYLGPAGDSR